MAVAAPLASIVPTEICVAPAAAEAVPGEYVLMTLDSVPPADNPQVCASAVVGATAAASGTRRRTTNFPTLPIRPRAPMMVLI